MKENSTITHFDRIDKDPDYNRIVIEIIKFELTEGKSGLASGWTNQPEKEGLHASISLHCWKMFWFSVQ